MTRRACPSSNRDATEVRLPSNDDSSSSSDNDVRCGAGRSLPRIQRQHDVMLTLVALTRFSNVRIKIKRNPNSIDQSYRNFRV